MNKITFRDWHYTCDEDGGCCDEYGTSVSINDSEIIYNANVTLEEMKLIVKALNIEVEFEEINEWDDDEE